MQTLSTNSTTRILSLHWQAHMNHSHTLVAAAKSSTMNTMALHLSEKRCATISKKNASHNEQAINWQKNIWTTRSIFWNIKTQIRYQPTNHEEDYKFLSKYCRLTCETKLKYLSTQHHMQISAWLALKLVVSINAVMEAPNRLTILHCIKHEQTEPHILAYLCLTFEETTQYENHWPSDAVVCNNQVSHHEQLCTKTGLNCDHYRNVWNDIIVDTITIHCTRTHARAWAPPRPHI